MFLQSKKPFITEGNAMQNVSELGWTMYFSEAQVFIETKEL